MTALLEYRELATAPKCVRFETQSYFDYCFPPDG
jgi:hypothetical protein